MADSIGDLLPKKRFSEPKEIEIIKRFILDNFNQPANISLHQTNIIITVGSSAFAGALRARLHELQRLCHTDKQLVIRIGS